MGWWPPKTPRRPSWMNDQLWKAILNRERRHLREFERKNRQSCYEMIVVCVVASVIGATVLILF